MKYLLSILAVIVLISCEGNVDYSGKVYDVATNEPLDSVKCIITKFKDYHTYTDSLGHYFISTPLVGCVPDCDKYSIEFSKKGYKTQVKYHPTDIFLEKE